MKTVKRSPAVIAILVLISLGVVAQEAGSPRPKTPRMTTDDLRPSKTETSPSLPVADSIPVNRSTTGARKLSNPRAVLETAINRLSEIRSVRMRVQGGGQMEGLSEILMETRPQPKLKVMGFGTEMIVVGETMYVRTPGRDWQSTPAPATLDSLKFKAEAGKMIDELLAKSNSSLSGRVLGEGEIDGIEVVLYEFTATSGGKKGSLEVAIGKADGLFRRFSGDGVGSGMTILLDRFDEDFGIEPPIK